MSGKTAMRTNYCGDIDSSLLDETVVVCGWVKKIRNHGGIVFVDLRDRSGVVQLVSNPNDEKVDKIMKSLKREFVVQAEGIVRRRPEVQINKNMKTGEVEILIRKIKILNESDEPPIEIKDDVTITDANRLKYRYLDLRRPKIQSNIIFRHKVVKAVRDFLDSEGFIEIETPLFVKSTPEGARDFLVPSRLHHGKFYALPQSPQIYKQLLMVAGFDRYFQIAKCLRDEDLRADRQPEFTQIDMEMSFIKKEDIMDIVERMIKYSVERVLKREIKVPFERISYDTAMNDYGSDKPDLRFELKLKDIKDEAKSLGLSIFDKAESVKALKVKSLFSRKKIKEFEELVKVYKAKGLAWLSIKDNEIVGSIAKFAGKEFTDKIGLSDGETLFIIAGDKETVNISLGQLRLKLGQELNLINEDELKFVWVVDFPMFEWNEDEKRIEAKHHPFTRPKEEDLDKLEEKPLEVRAEAYDIVLNGWEIGGGSLRINEPGLQKRVFKIIGLSDEKAREKFGFLMDAMKYGAPPHGGLAIGLDRFVTLLKGMTDIREFIAFPKNKSAENPMDGSPSEVSDEQLKELGIKVLDKEKD